MENVYDLEYDELLKYITSEREAETRRRMKFDGEAYQLWRRLQEICPHKIIKPTEFGQECVMCFERFK